jgi:PmbA protein
VAEDGGDAEMGSDSRTVSFLDQLDSKAVAASAAEEALELLHAGAAPTMVCPVVLKSSVAADLIGFLAASFSAENVDKNFSLLAGRKGERVFSEKVSIIDDALLPGGAGTAPFDGEGTPAATTPLVAEGVLENYLYDGYYARKHGARSTASLRRGSAKNAPSIGTSNIYLKAGARGRDALIGEVGKGLYLTGLLGLHTANPVTGEFSVGASGILIENGRLTRPVKGFAVAGTLSELFQQMTETGSDIRFWGGTGAPSALVARLSVSGK